VHSPTLLTYQGGGIEVSIKPKSGKGRKEGAVTYLAAAEVAPSANKPSGRNNSSAIVAAPKCMSRNTCVRSLRQPLASLYTQGTLWLQTPLNFCPSTISVRMRRIFADSVVFDLFRMYGNAIGEPVAIWRSPSSLTCRAT
jgi:hypothetical protein